MQNFMHHKKFKHSSIKINILIYKNIYNKKIIVKKRKKTNKTYIYVVLNFALHPLI